MVRTNTFTRFTARLAVSVLCAALLFVVPVHAVLAAPALAPSLGTAGSFTVLGATTVTNTGATVITGDLGVSPGTAITGFRPAPFNTIVGPGTVTGGGGLVTGTIYASGPIAAQAHDNASTAYNYLVAQTPDTTYAPMEIGGLTFTPGVYYFPSSAQITTTAGPVTLDFQGDPNAVFIFQIESTLITDVGSQVIVTNAASNVSPGANVYWAVGSSATIGVNSQFVGNILAIASITLNHGASLYGRALAINAAVTMDTNNVSLGKPGCDNKDKGKPGCDNKDKGKPGCDNKDKGKPGCDNKDKGKPGYDNKDNGKLGCDNKDNGKPGYDNKDNGRPGYDNKDNGKR